MDEKQKLFRVFRYGLTGCLVLFAIYILIVLIGLFIAIS